MSKGMEKHEIYHFQLREVQNVLRLTHNIYRSDDKDESAYDRMLKKSRKMVDNALEGNPDQFVSTFDKYTPPPSSRKELKSLIIENMKGIIVDHEARSDEDTLEFYADVFTTIAMEFSGAEKLQKFKDYVHKRLDDAGIEKEPNGEHSKAGCRIGDRLDIILGKERPISASCPSGMCDGTITNCNCKKDEV